MKLVNETWDEGGEPINLAQPRPHTFLDRAIYIAHDARMTEVWIKGVPSTQIEKCVVDRARGTVTLGTWQDALRARRA